MDAGSFQTFAQPHHSRGSLAQRPPGSSRVVPVLFASKQSARVPIFFSECRFLPKSDRKYLAKSRQIQSIINRNSDIEDTEETPTFEPTVSLVSNRVSIRLSPY